VCKQKELIAKAEREFQAKKRKLQEDVERSGGVYGKEQLAAYNAAELASAIEDEHDIAMAGVDHLGSSGLSGVGLVRAHINVPSVDDIKQQVLEHKRQQLLDMYL
jgi:hypothetical protein